MNIKRLQELKETPYQQIDKELLPDLSDIFINTSIPIAERMQQYCDCVENPYYLRAGVTIIEVKFTENKSSIENKMKEYLSNAKYM